MLPIEFLSGLIFYVLYMDVDVEDHINDLDMLIIL